MRNQVSFVHLLMRRLIWLGPLTVFASTAVVFCVRLIVVAVLQPPSTFRPLGVLPPIVDTAALVTWAVLVFIGMVRFVHDPIHRFKTLSVVVLLLSFLPDIALVKWRVWNATWGYAFALMIMHVAAWGTCVTMLTRLGLHQIAPHDNTGAANKRVSAMRSINTVRLAFIAPLACVDIWPAGWRHKIALIILIAISGLYGLLLQRLRSRRIGSAAAGSFYDMLEQDKRRAVEIIVEKKAEEQPPEDAEGTGPKPRRSKVYRSIDG
jgi:hypothetical protein